MSNTLYRLNKQTLEFEKIELSLKQRISRLILKVLVIVTPAFVLGYFMFIQIFSVQIEEQLDHKQALIIHEITGLRLRDTIYHFAQGAIPEMKRFVKAFRSSTEVSLDVVTHRALRSADFKLIHKVLSH